MSIDSWKTTEPDREPAPGEHRPYDAFCDCDDCCPAAEEDEEDLPEEQDECTCSRSREDQLEECGFPCSYCGRTIR